MEYSQNIYTFLVFFVNFCIDLLFVKTSQQESEEYELFKDSSIAKLTREKIDLLKSKYTKQDRTFKVTSPNWDNYEDLSGIKIESIIDCI